jgi:hypothetical protein
MSKAIIEISSGYHSVNIGLEYNYVADNTWSCDVGYLPAQKGGWSSYRSNKKVYLMGERNEFILVLDDVDVQSSYGYPFDGLTGVSGTGMVALGGRISGDAAGRVNWRFLAA